MVEVTDTKHPVVTKLIERQRRDGLTDTAFAELLGIPRGTWSPTRLGYKAMGVTVAKAAKRFPETEAEATAWLVQWATERIGADTATDDAA